MRSCLLCWQNSSEFTILPTECQREGECQRQGGGGHREVGTTDLKERERGNDRLIYSKSEEWVNQTLMAFGSAHRSPSPFNLAPFQAFLVRSHLTSFTPLFFSPLVSLSPKYTFRWSLANISPPFFLTDKFSTHLCVAHKSRCSSCSAG